jgi:hypothetical protein
LRPPDHPWNGKRNGKLVKRKPYQPRERSKITFRYRRQFGVIVIVEDEKEQARVYARLVKSGLRCRVVAV